MQGFAILVKIESKKVLKRKKVELIEAENRMVAARKVRKIGRSW